MKIVFELKYFYKLFVIKIHFTVNLKIMFFFPLTILKIPGLHRQVSYAGKGVLEETDESESW